MITYLRAYRHACPFSLALSRCLSCVCSLVLLRAVDVVCAVVCAFACDRRTFDTCKLLGACGLRRSRA